MSALAPAAWAQEASNSAEVAAARELGREGIALANEGKCAEAVDRLERAVALRSSPILYVRLGECQLELGRMVDGTESFRRATREAPGPSSAALKAAQERARKLLAATQPRLAKLTVSVEAPAGASYAVKLDGVPIAQALLGVARPTDPGSHAVEAAGPGLKPAGVRVVLPEGGAETVALALEALPPAPARPPPPPPSPAPERWSVPAGRREGEGLPRWPAFVAFGVGAAGLGLGGTFGVLALRKSNELERDCDSQKRCAASSRADYDAADRYALGSTLGFVVGGVGLAGGLALYLLSSKPPARAGGSGAGVTLAPWVSASSGGVAGTF